MAPKAIVQSDAALYFAGIRPGWSSLSAMSDLPVGALGLAAWRLLGWLDDQARLELAYAWIDVVAAKLGVAQ